MKKICTCFVLLAAFGLMGLGVGCKKNVKTKTIAKTVTPPKKTGPSFADLQKVFFQDLTIGFLTSGGIKPEELLAIVKNSLKGKGNASILEAGERDIQQLRKVFLELYGAGERVPIRLSLKFDYPKNIKAMVMDLDRRFNIFVYHVGRLKKEQKAVIESAMRKKYQADRKMVTSENFVYLKMTEDAEGARGFPYAVLNDGKKKPFWITKQDTTVKVSLFFLAEDNSLTKPERVAFNLVSGKPGISGKTITPNNITDRNDPPKEFLFSSLKIVRLTKFTGNIYKFHKKLIETTALAKFPNRTFEIAKKRAYLSYDIGPGGAGGAARQAVTLEGKITVRGGEAPEQVKIQVNFLDGSKAPEVDITSKLIQSGDDFNYHQVLKVAKPAKSYTLRYKLKGSKDIKTLTFNIGKSK